MTRRPIATEVWLSGEYGDPIASLQDFYRKCSLPSFDRRKSVALVHLQEIVITRDLLNLLLKCLNLPLARDPTGGSTVRWISMTFDQSQFADDNSLSDEEDCCTRDDIHGLISAVADRTWRLEIKSCHQIMSYFLSTPGIEHIGVENFHIEQEQNLSAVEYIRLDHLIRRSVQLKKLYLCLPFDSGETGLMDGLASAINIQELNLEQSLSISARQAELVVGPLIQLLQHPQNQLKNLRLWRLGLNDQHLIAISQLLPTCQIEEFQFSHNLIQSKGMLEFARQLPSIHSLKHARFDANPWEESAAERKAVGAALLQGINENTSLEFVDSLDYIPQPSLLWYGLVLNCAGRRLLASSQPIPDGLWPLVLERAGNLKRYFVSETTFAIEPTRATARCNALYFLLQNCPILRMHTDDPSAEKQTW